jgi:hypothetical protein
MPTRFHLGATAPASANAAGFMSALSTLFAVTNDVDTAAAVTDTITWTRDNTAGSEAMYSSPFGPRNTRIIIAVQDSGTPSPSPTMIISADIYATANVLIGLADNATGAYVSWYAAAPFMGCTFAGYYRLCATTGLTSVRAMVSSKDLKLQVINGTGVITAHAGAIIKGAVGFQESDGFRYGLMVSGAQLDMVSNWRGTSTLGAGQYTKNSTSNGGAHTGIYAMGGTTWQTLVPGDLSWGNPETLDFWKLDATTAARVGIVFIRSAAPHYVVGTWNGVTKSATGMTGQNVTGTGDTAVRFSASVATTNEDSCLVWRTYT